MEASELLKENLEEGRPCAVIHFDPKTGEVTGEEHRLGGGSPLAVVPAVLGPVEAEEPVAVGEICQGAVLAHQGISGPLIVFHPQFQVGLEILQLRIKFGDIEFHIRHPFKYTI